MCNSGPTLTDKPLLGQLATCVPIEICVFQLNTHAKMHLGLPDMKQNLFNKILNDSTIDLPLAYPGMSGGMVNHWTKCICFSWLCQWLSVDRNAIAFIMCDSADKLPLGHLATCVPIEVCVRTCTHAEIRVWHGTRIFNKILNDSTTDLPLA